MDITYILLLVGFFALAWGFVRFSRHLLERES